jgi:hypothetical protein
MTAFRNPGATLQAGGTTYSLSFSMRAMCALEDALNRTAPDVVVELIKAGSDAKTLRMKTLLVVLWVMLRDNHPEIDEDGASDIATAAGVMATLVAVAAAAAAAFPPPKKGAQPKEEARPQTA